MPDYDVFVEVASQFLPKRSSPEEGQYYFAYRIKIQNQGERVVQLLRRHWVITDGTGSKQEVRGAGVVGQKPVIPPGETFEYASFCVLSTPVGVMQGDYEMISLEGEVFSLPIAPFTLAAPNALH